MAQKQSQRAASTSSFAVSAASVPKLTHQKHTISELEEDVEAEQRDVLLPLTQTIAVSCQTSPAEHISSGGFIITPPTELQLHQHRGAGSDGYCSEQPIIPPLIIQPNTPVHAGDSMENEMLLEDCYGSYYSSRRGGGGGGGSLNGGVQMNILSAGSEDTPIDCRSSNNNSRLRHQHSASPTSGFSSRFCDTNISSSISNSTNTSTQQQYGAGCCSNISPINNRQQQHQPKSVSTLYGSSTSYSPAAPAPPPYSPSLARNRQRFANLRSVSTDVPSRREGDTPLSKLSSHSGPLLRVNSFERGTQTGHRPVLHRLNTEHRASPRYESAISDIGVEYMKATGVLGIKFKQLQKPSSQSRESVNVESSKHLNYEPGGTAEETKAAKVPSPVPQNPSPSVPMSRQSVASTCLHNPNSNNDVREHLKPTPERSEEETITIPKDQHIGYRLGRRKLLAERRRKIADLCCGFALIGLILMVIETECDIANVYTKVRQFTITLIFFLNIFNSAYWI